MRGGLRYLSVQELLELRDALACEIQARGASENLLTERTDDGAVQGPAS